MLDIQKGKLLATICATTNAACNSKLTQKKLEKLMNQISFVYYDELRHEIVTGHENGSIVIWN